MARFCPSFCPFGHVLPPSEGSVPFAGFCPNGHVSSLGRLPPCCVAPSRLTLHSFSLTFGLSQMHLHRVLPCSPLGLPPFPPSSQGMEGSQGAAPAPWALGRPRHLAPLRASPARPWGSGVWEQCPTPAPCCPMAGDRAAGKGGRAGGDPAVRIWAWLAGMALLSPLLSSFHSERDKKCKEK